MSEKVLEIAPKSAPRASCVLDEETCLYRHWDAEGKLLYVGISLNSIARLIGHREHSAWFRKIAGVTMEWHPTRRDALAAERIAVRLEKPEYNVMLKPNKAYKEYLHRVQAEEARRQLVQRMVNFKPAYSLDEAAVALGLSGAQSVKRLISEGRIGGRLEGRSWVVTGWQLIDYVEAMGGKKP